MNTAAARVLRSLPWSAELYQRWQGDQPPGSGYRLDRLESALPGWVEAVGRARAGLPAQRRRRVLVFAFLSWWLEHATALSLVLAGLGHEVTLAFLPFRRWTRDPSDFDRRRQVAYLRSVLAPVRRHLHLAAFQSRAPAQMPRQLELELEPQVRLDVQYSRQREDVDLAGVDQELARLRAERNRAAAAETLAVLGRVRPEAVIVPNGSILEFAAVYHAARSIGVRVTTYEFGEQRERIWLAQDDQVMRQDTSEMWKILGSRPLDDREKTALAQLFQARQGGQRWANFARQWQSRGSRGAEAARQALGLDPSRPTALVCTNVVADSLALDRQVFSEGMSDWLAGSVRRLAGDSGVQTVVRVHPGEMLGAGHPSQDIVRESLSGLPEGMRLVGPDSELNTYDLIGLADFGLVYTSTVGMEMALAGLPVVVAGRTHYRGKGFTIDPETWDEFDRSVGELMRREPGRRLSEDQVSRAERYAYRFFFDYPFAFPWHLIGFWDDIGSLPMESVLEPERLARYRPAFDVLSGERPKWGTEG